ncbi:potassium transporter [Sneathiella sp. P13V-1]|uniref:saccharopine dehydrogenase family protein n=1 Tax=Sneathiella sp. P13V-1 TaxID=2697366 RepID=UPI00187B701A|nr:saccharopine dehydrogenase NADP-binding domain-containing protein [Sneathiella sp. P13V-1]MBE7636594.1 potassium transporter [Sneathiella sp. P13V-1]
MKRVLIIGGYGNFGKYIASTLSKDPNLHIIVAGRSLQKAQKLALEIDADALKLDISDDIKNSIEACNPNIVIHTSGPFQAQGYEVALACIHIGAHYIDLADGREFVVGIERLNEQAEAAEVLAVSGASSVPCLTSALVDHYELEFETLESLDYGITTAQKTTRGLATTAAILGYTGKPFKTLLQGKNETIYGWQGLKARNYKDLGTRLLGNCDIPDLSIFPKRYPSLQTIRFYAGLELKFLHMALWMLSGLVRLGLIPRLEKLAPFMLRASFLFDVFGSEDSGFHMQISGKDKAGNTKQILFELTARKGDGPYIPCMPAILLCKKIASGELTKTGATPGVGLITKDDYLSALSDLAINWTEEVTE